MDKIEFLIEQYQQEIDIIGEDLVDTKDNKERGCLKAQIEIYECVINYLKGLL